VAPRSRLRVPLTPDLLAAEDPGEEALVLSRGSELHHRRSDHGEPERAEQGRARELELLGQNEAPGRVEAGATEFSWPVWRNPALRMEELVPTHDVVHVEGGVDVGLGAEVRGHRPGDPVADFATKRLLLGGEGQVHGASAYSKTGFPGASRCSDLGRVQ